MFFTVSLIYSEITLSMQFVFLHEITCFINIQTPRTVPSLGKCQLSSLCMVPVVTLNIILYSLLPVNNSGRFTSVFLLPLSPFWHSAYSHGVAGIYYFFKQLQQLLEACVSLQINFSVPLSICCCFITLLPDGQQAPVLSQDQPRCYSILTAAMLLNSLLETG